MTRTCLFCGITFLAPNPARQYCSAECRKNAAEARVTMIDFSLSRTKKKALPDTVEVDGSVYDIRPGFRNILKILRLQNDPDVLDGHKAELLRRWFFDGEAPEAWAEAFGHFVRAGDEPELPAGERDFDYEFDAPEIYASFRQLYGIDLMDEDLHWWQFRALLGGCFLCRCALSEKIRLRHLDVSKCEDKAAAQRAKDAAAIPDAVGIDERLLTEQVRERLLRGESIEDLIRSEGDAL